MLEDNKELDEKISKITRFGGPVDEEWREKTLSEFSQLLQDKGITLDKLLAEADLILEERGGIRKVIEDTLE